MEHPAPQPPEPLPTRFDLHGRLFGAPLRIHPLFWPAAALIGWQFYAMPDRPNVGLFFLWLLCVLVSLLIHDLGHVAMGRLLGARLGIVWYGLGSMTTGLEALPWRTHRLAVYLAGPLAQLLVFAALWSVSDMQGGFVQYVTTAAPLREWGGKATALFMIFTLCWSVLDLLPIWPLDGGLFFREWCAGLFGRIGPMIALVVCIFVAAGLGLMFGQWMSVRATLRVNVLGQWMSVYSTDPQDAVLLQQYAILILFSVFFVISGFRALRIEYRHWRGQPAGLARPN